MAMTAWLGVSLLSSLQWLQHMGRVIEETSCLGNVGNPPAFILQEIFSLHTFQYSAGVHPEGIPFKRSFSGTFFKTNTEPQEDSYLMGPSSPSLESESTDI